MKDEIVREDKHIPREAYDKLGCIFCEWRHTKDCPFLNKEKLITVFPEEKICDRRRAWIYLLSRTYENIPSFSQWQLDFNKALAQTRMLKAMNLEEYFNEEAKHFERMNDAEGVNRSYQKAHKQRIYWETIWKEMCRLDDLQVNRETPKRIEVTKREEIGIMQVGELIKRNEPKMIDITPTEVKDA